MHTETDYSNITKQVTPTSSISGIRNGKNEGMNTMKKCNYLHKDNATLPMSQKFPCYQSICQVLIIV
jgi:hypothetical protein